MAETAELAQEHDHELLHLIREQEKEVRRLEAQLDADKQEVKETKDLLNAALHRLRKLAADQDDHPLLQGNGEPVTEEQWRGASLDELGIVGAVADKLREAGLDTLGKIADFTADNELTDIAGVGPSKAEEIEEKLTAYWATHSVTTDADDDDHDKDDE